MTMFAPHMALALWAAFLDDRPDQVPAGPLSHDEYVAIAPLFGQWLMAGAETDNFLPAQLWIEAVWRAMTGQPAYRAAIADALLETDIPCGGLPFDTALGFDGVIFPYPAVLAVLALDPEDADVERPLTLLEVLDAEGPHQAVTLTELIDRLSVFSELPACVNYWRWMCEHFVPAIMRHGHYDPARAHEPPVGQELDALERREGARDVLDALLPGLLVWGDDGPRPQAEEAEDDDTPQG